MYVYVYILTIHLNIYIYSAARPPIIIPPQASLPASSNIISTSQRPAQMSDPYGQCVVPTEPQLSSL